MNREMARGMNSTMFDINEQNGKQKENFELFTNTILRCSQIISLKNKIFKMNILLFTSNCHSTAKTLHNHIIKTLN